MIVLQQRLWRGTQGSDASWAGPGGVARSVSGRTHGAEDLVILHIKYMHVYVYKSIDMQSIFF